MNAAPNHVTGEAVPLVAGETYRVYGVYDFACPCGRGDALLDINVDFAWCRTRFRLLPKPKAEQKPRQVEVPKEAEKVWGAKACKFPVLFFSFSDTCSACVQAIAKVQQMSENIRTQIVDAAERGRLLELIFKDFGSRNLVEGDPEVRSLRDLHNSGIINLLEIVTAESLKPYSGRNFFDGALVYRLLISELSGSAESVLKAVQALVRAGGDDLASGLPIEEMQKWCAADPNRPLELLSLVERKMPNADRFLGMAIKTGVLTDRTFFVDQAFSFLASGTETEKQSAINALALQTFEGPREWDRLLGAFADALEPDPGQRVRAALLSAANRLQSAAGTEESDRLGRIAKRACEAAGEELLYIAARSIATDMPCIPLDVLDAMLDALETVDASHNGTINNLDFALATIIKHGEVVRARNCVERLISRDVSPIPIDRFDSVRSQLFAEGGKVLDDWVVPWLLEGSAASRRALGEYLLGSGLESHIFTVQFSSWGLQPADYAFVARKAISSFFLKPINAASLVVCLLRSCPDDVVDELVELLVDPLLLNYSSVAEDYLEPIALDQNDTAMPYVRRALDSLESYLSATELMGSVPELLPSARERRMEMERHSDKMIEAMRVAQQNSPLLSAVSQTIMLYGRRSIAWMQSGNAEPRRIETELASIGHSVEIPRVDVVDPVGLHMRLASFASEARPS